MIDNCEYSFQQLACNVLPAHMRRMRRAMKNAVSLKRFSQNGMGPVAFLREIGKEEDFAGCYVLIFRNRAIYVGISRGVAVRVLQHIKGRTHYSASLAYRIASYRMPHGLQQKVAMQKPRFKKVFNDAKAYLARCKVAVIQIDNALERHFFEAYCAMKLNTKKWNTFETH